MIYRAREHQPLAGGSWDARRARYAIDEIVDEARAAEPLEEPGIWDGAAGEAYALRVLGYEAPLDVRSDEQSFGFGELGIAVVEGDRARAEPAARASLVSPENELLFGTGGVLVAAVHLELDDLAHAAVERLWSTWTFDPKLRACIWTQEIEGKESRYLGASHGLAGNVYALLRAARFQSPQHQSELLDRTVDVLKRTALVERGLANWPTAPGAPVSKLRVQWCHGAPGIVTSLAGAPAHRELDAILLAAGELTWRAGPLRKGPCLCHGTAGNGFAFLKLYARTRDTKWLERARRFAMHAIAQRTGERGLWAGDLGVALYLRACIEAEDDWPLLDVV